MAILTNPIFWIIIVLIILLMAIVGYLAEGLELNKKDNPSIAKLNNDEETPEPQPMPVEEKLPTPQSIPTPTTDPIPIEKLFDKDN